MLADIRTTQIALAASTAQAMPTDPWDAPYFGGPIYFRYPDFPGTSQAVQAGAPARAHDPVPADPPLAALVVIVEAMTESSSESADEAEVSTTALPPAGTSPPAKSRRSWLARLFGWG